MAKRTIEVDMQKKSEAYLELLGTAGKGKLQGADHEMCFFFQKLPVQAANRV